MKVVHVAEGDSDQSPSAASTVQHDAQHHARHNGHGQWEYTTDTEPHDRHMHFNTPHQMRFKHQIFVGWLGRLGWVGKGVVYAIIGGLCCQSAVNAEGAPPGASVSPQGAFVLVASNPTGAPLLIVLAVGLVSYIMWRYAEAITGQGYDAEFSRLKNFFRFRLSPFVSGTVYCAYLAFILDLLAKMAQHQDLSTADNSDFTLSWRQSGIGKFGLTILGIAFLAATIVQLDWVIRGQWHTDYRGDLPRWATYFVFALGHLGCLGRMGVFLTVSILFFKEVTNAYTATATGETTIANAFSQLQGNNSMRSVLFVMGFLLVIYGTFAVVSSWARIYPTPPPSRRPKVPEGSPPLVYELRGNMLGRAHLLAAPAGVAAAGAALHDIESGTASKPHEAQDTTDMLRDAQRGHQGGIMHTAQPHKLREDAAFWCKAGKRARLPLARAAPQAPSASPAQPSAATTELVPRR